jgi:hypothetical protein
LCFKYEAVEDWSGTKFRSKMRWVLGWDKNPQTKPKAIERGKKGRSVYQVKS